MTVQITLTVTEAASQDGSTMTMTLTDTGTGNVPFALHGKVMKDEQGNVTKTARQDCLDMISRAGWTVTN